MKKLWTIFAFAAISFGLSAQDILQTRVDLQVDDASVDDVIHEISLSTQVYFSYSASLFPENLRFNLSFQNATLEQVLLGIIGREAIEFKVVGEQVVLFSSEKGLKSEKNRTYTLSGYIEDSRTGERLISANIYTPDFQGTSSNNDGFYSLKVNSDSVLVSFSYTGYKTVSKLISLNNNEVLSIQMEPSVSLQEVTVIGRIEPTQQFVIEMGETAEGQLMNAMPTMGGETDLIRLLQLLPGVQAGNEGTAGLFVRGGSPDQNLVLLDGVPVYYPNHLFGIFSIFNNASVRKATLVKEGFPARFGGRLSSVLDVRLKDGNQNKLSGEFGIGLVSGQFALEGPLVNNKTTFLFSARRSHIDLFMTPISRTLKKNEGADGFSNSFFYDLNAKISHRFNAKDQLSFSMYRGMDTYKDHETFTYFNDIELTQYAKLNMDWENTLVSLAWNHMYSDKLYSRSMIYFSGYQFNYDDLTVITEHLPNQEDLRNSGLVEYSSNVKELTLKSDFDLLPHPDHFLRFGLSGSNYWFRPGANAAFEFHQTLNTVADTTFFNPFFNGTQVSAYLEDDIRLATNLKLNAGIHFSVYNNKDRLFWSAEPRLSLAYYPMTNLRLKASFSTMTQYLHLLTNSGLGLPTDLWIPPTGELKPQRSWQTGAGLTWSLPSNYSINMDGYYKQTNNLLDFKNESRFLLSSENLEENLTTGNGWSYGGEFMFKKEKGKTTYWLSYTLSWTQRKFPEINNGEIFPFKYDRRHDISLAGFHKFNKNIEISSVWIYGTGNAVTLPISEFPVLNPQSLNFPLVLYDYGRRNNYRLPAVHRLDVGVNYRWNSKWANQVLSFSLYNVYNRQNPFFISLEVDKDNPGKRMFTQTTIFPIIPSLRYRAKF